MAKRRKELYAVLAGAFLCVLSGLCGSDPVAPALTAALKRGDAAACQAALGTLLDAAEKLSGTGDLRERWQPLRQSKGYTLALAQSELFRVTGPEALSGLLADASGRAFLAALLSDREWLESYLASGPVPENTASGLATLREIWRADRALESAEDRRLATAVALVFNTEPMKGRLLDATTRDKNPLTPLARYTFYKESRKRGKLRPLFDALAVWELRWVVCAPVENEALAWLQQNVDMPVDKFDDACWIPRYRGVNDFGNTIQGPLFYAPSRPGSNWAEDVARHGGVCGSLSTFGAFNAMARGLPAMPKGQPGHCAYTFRVAPGEWVPGFGGPDGGAAYHFWKDSFSYVWLADEAFSNGEALRESMRLAWLARRAAARGNASEARAAYELAVAAQPLNWSVWQEALAAFLADSTCTKQVWQRLTDALLQGMAKHPMPMCELLEQFDEKALYPQLNADEKRALFTKIHDAIAANQRPGWTPWEMPKALMPRQLKALGGVERAGAFFGDALSCYCRHPHEYLLGQMIDWGTENLAKNDAGREAFFAAITQALGGGEKLDGKLRESLLNRAIRAAEAARSVEGFHLLSDAAAAYSKREGEVKVAAPFGGQLVSGDGLLYLSGFDGYDAPVCHRDVLREKGGFFHCQAAEGGKDESKWVVVQLRQRCMLSGLAIVNRTSNQGRCKALRVFVSNDEKTWAPIAKTDAFEQQWSVDLRDKNIGARWIKVENATVPSEAFHLRNICVYGEVAK